jgi:hypothetical protein
MGVIDGAINMDGGLEPWVLKPPGIEPQPEGMIGETDAVEGLCFRIGTTEFRSLGVTPFIVGVLPDENRRLTSSTADTYELNCASAIAAGSYAVHIGYSLFSVEWWEQRPLPPAHTSVTPSEHHRSLPVVPLIPDKRYYGEAPGRPAGQSGAGLEEKGGQRLDCLGCLTRRIHPRAGCSPLVYTCMPHVYLLYLICVFLALPCLHLGRPLRLVAGPILFVGFRFRRVLVIR